MSPPDTLEAHPVQLEAHQVYVVLKGFEGGLYDLSLPPIYLKHAVRHVWNKEVKITSIYFLKHIFKISDDGLFFCKTVML